MPRSDKRGAPPQFPYSVAEIKERFEHYKAEYESGDIKKPCWPDFLTRNGISIEEGKDTINNPVNSNILLSKELQKMLDWCTAVLMTAPGWSGPNSIKAIYLSKQDFGGKPYSDRQDINASGKMDINVRFGSKSKDPFR